MLSSSRVYASVRPVRAAGRINLERARINVSAPSEGEHGVKEDQVRRRQPDPNLWTSTHVRHVHVAHSYVIVLIESLDRSVVAGGRRQAHE